MGKTITIIGDGAMGTVCGKVLAEKHCRVRLWSAFPRHAREMNLARENRRFLPGVPLPAGIEIASEPDGVFDGAEMAISAVPTQFTREVWQRLKAHFPAGLAVCSVTKGIENGSLLTPSKVLTDVLAGSPDGDWPVAVMSGPSIATELAQGLPTTVVAASRDAALAAAVQELFTTSYLRVYTNSDIVGVEVAAATKNVIAIAAGILDGLQAGDNAKAALLTRGLVEIRRLGVAMKGRPETFSGLAGVGDLVTTCISPHGRNRSFGQAVGRGAAPEEALAGTESVVEGVATTVSVLELAKRLGVEMPITQAVHAVIFEGRHPQQAILGLMSRPLKAED